MLRFRNSHPQKNPPATSLADSNAGNTSTHNRRLNALSVISDESGSGFRVGCLPAGEKAAFANESRVSAECGERCPLLRRRGAGPRPCVRSWRRRQAVAAHDLGQLRTIRRPIRRSHHRRDLVEVLRTDGRGRDDAYRLGVLAAVVVETMRGAARDAQRLSGADVERLAADGPGKHPAEAVDRLFVVMVAVGRRHQLLRGWNRELEDRDAATRIFSRDEKSHAERAETDGLFGWIDTNVTGERGHGPALLLWWRRRAGAASRRWLSARPRELEVEYGLRQSASSVTALHIT